MKSYKVATSLATSLLIVVCGAWLFTAHEKNIYIPAEVRKNTTPQYNLINPLIFIDTDQNLYPELDSLDAKINSYVASAEKSNTASSVSVYFRDLNSGHWTGTNENEQYEPSSMLKVVVMISYFRTALQDETILSEKLNYPGTDDGNQYYKDSKKLGKGQYTVQELIDHMIIDSDNASVLTLVSHEQEQFQSVYDDFRLPNTPAFLPSITDYMTPKSYSVVFRSLYNGSYLTRKFSQDALKLLTQTTFNDGLVAGVPKGTVVAHKFGEHAYVEKDGILVSKQLHDCGIVYYPSNPYFVCVMTKGDNFSKLAGVISDISKIVYDYVNQDK